MKESILHYVWQHRLFSVTKLKTIDGQTVEVIDTGKPNTDSGPDFFNAKLKIGDTLWAGNIEIHNQSSDWQKHRHEKNKAYDNVILHVVNQVDTAVFRTNGEPVPQMELKVPVNILENYNELLTARKWIPCQDKLAYVPPILMSSWKNALLAERLERKTIEVETMLTQSNNHWDEAFYLSLARSFGFSVNGEAFGLMAKWLPLSIIGKHKNNLFQLEALFFGQAGLLTSGIPDDYRELLLKEYLFLRAKYNLRPIDGSLWKLLRLRPDNFPHVRLAQFAALAYQSVRLFSKVIKAGDVKALRELFVCEVSDYWQCHYQFGTRSPRSLKRLGEKSVDLLIINTVVPFLFAYAYYKGENTDIVLKLLEDIPAESNVIIKRWDDLGFPSRNSFDSQALLQLKNNYCDLKKCLRCRIGHKVLTYKPPRP